MSPAFNSSLFYPEISPGSYNSIRDRDTKVIRKQRCSGKIPEQFFASISRYCLVWHPKRECDQLPECVRHSIGSHASPNRLIERNHGRCQPAFCHTGRPLAGKALHRQGGILDIHFLSNWIFSVDTLALIV